jgi:predicted AAA+ superfamily ATPase
VKFQRTRGVLRLMAAVIHSLWEKGDRNPLIMPANISIDEPRVQFELTRYLSDNWVPVIEKDVDGPNALPLRLDSEFHASFGKYQAFRRVARTIYLGSAPTATAANRGIEDRRIKLGCAMPGESPAIFGDALRRLSVAATYLYPDGARYWYSTQPTVTKLAEDRAEQLKREPDKVAQELDKRLRADLRDKGDFCRVHPLPTSGADVADEMEARLVVLGIEHPYSKEAGNPAERAARAILETRGNSPRLFQNALGFLAVDKARLQDLDEAVRRYLAWEYILDEKADDLSPHQSRQAQQQKKSADDAVIARIPEAYQWLLVPAQTTPQSAVVWQSYRLTGTDKLAVRASKKLMSDESLIAKMVGTRLKMELDKIPLWRGDHVAIKQLVEDFARYIYLPRLKNPSVLISAIQDGLSLLLWPQETFAYADSYDESAQRYRGLRAGRHIDISVESPSGLLVRPDVAQKQLEAETPTPPPRPTELTDDTETTSRLDTTTVGETTINLPTPKPAPTPTPKRFHGSVTLNPTRVGRDAGRIADEVISHLTGLVGANVKITLEIEAEIPGGAPDHVVRTVTENSQTLKFTSHGFEME